MVILLIVFFATLWSIYNFYRLNEQIKLSMEENYSSIIAVDNMSRSLDAQMQALIIMFNQNYELGESLFEKNKKDFYFWYQQARISANTEEETIVLDSLNYYYEVFNKNFYDKTDYGIYIRSNQSKIKIIFLSLVNDIHEIKKWSDSILEVNHTLLNDAVDNVKEITKTATLFILLILIGAIVVSIVFGTKFSNYVVRPIINLRKSVQKISEGNFDQKIEIDENSDEINILGEEFNKMAERLQKFEQLNLNKILFEKKKSELTIESMNEPVLMIDENFNVLLTNKNFNDLLSKKFNTKQKLRNVVPLFNNTPIIESDKEKEILFGNDLIAVKDGSGNQKYFRAIAATLNIPENEIRGAVIVFNDVTKYQELDRMKSEFIAKVSHELKTPLTSLGMALGIMEEGVVGHLTEKQLELIFSMKEDYERLNKLVYEILELAKLEANTGKIKFESFDVSKLSEFLSKKFSIQSKERKIRLEVINQCVGEKINGSYDHMLSAIENLVSNSLRFTPTGGEIKIEFRAEMNNIIIEISDTGIGISPDNLKKIFDKFIQIDDSAPGSLGLGLSIAKEIIEIHHGEIKAFSDLGKGSTFQIKLPAANV